ncbi:uncharacterized protein PAC_14604 [Phialocephala subalpina]|uniref:Protein kinase domain-containing protein n=1 Tax=Phialocephala subalpina TaxID=576137 RepID=A0A1L7XI38_9HELO|nr:uncharacterized protein PAC_14604 [Phialocephala subalpina]
MSELDETYRHSDEVIAKYIVQQIGANPNFSFKEPSTVENIARELAWECGGSKLIARLRLSIIASHKPYLRDCDVDAPFFRFWCGRWPRDQIYERALEAIKPNLETYDAARNFFFWVLHQGINGKDALLEALRSSSPSAVNWSDPATPEALVTLREHVKKLNIACGGLIATSEWESVHRIYMHPDIRSFLLRDDRWRELCSTKGASPTYGQVHGSLAASCATYIMTAYQELDGLPCPDDESMDQHLRKWPVLEYAGNNVARHIREAGTNLGIHWTVISKLILGDLTSFGSGQCIRQIEAASRNPERLQGWSQRYPEGVSLLVYAASEGLFFVVHSLLELGNKVRLEEKGTDGRTALAAAADNGHPDVVRYLLERGANLHARDPMMDTPLALAVAQGHIEVVEVLLRAGANPNLKALDGTTTAIIAASNGHASIVERLLFHGADPQAEDNNGETIMSHIVRLGDQNVDMANLPERYPALFQVDPDTRLLATAAVNRAVVSTTLACAPAHISASRQAMASKAEEFLRGDKSTSQVAYMPAEFRRQYQLRESLAHGSFSRCFSAVDRFTGRRCAVKASRARRTVGGNKWARDNRYRLEKEELESLKKFRHQNVSSLQNYIDVHQYVFMVFDLADGDLSDHFQKARMSEDQIREMMKQLFAGVRYLHDNNVIHCDLKPANILVFNDGATFKITDLGNSKHVISGSGNEKLISHCSGTQCYASPEASDSYKKRRDGGNSEPIRGPPCDIYSCGCILFEAFAWKYEWEQSEARLPGEFHNSQDKVDTWEAIRNRLALKLHEIRDDTKYGYWKHIPLRVESLVKVMLENEEEERATIQQCERSLWMRTDSSDFMSKEEHDKLRDYLPSYDRPEDYEKAVQVQIDRMKVFDMDENVLQHMPEMPRYYFEQLVLDRHNPLHWGWSIQAV